VGGVPAGQESSGFIGAVRLIPHRQGECILSATGLVARVGTAEGPLYELHPVGIE
jgi:hypothetical protein